MAEFTQLLTTAERQRLASQVRVLLQQPQLSDHHDYFGVKTTLKYHPARTNRQKGRRKHVMHQASSLECLANGMGLTCELVTAKGRDKVRVRSSGERFAALVVSKGSDGSQHFSVAIIDSVSKNLDVALGDEEEVTIVSIQPSTFLNSLREMTATGAKKGDFKGNGEISGVPGRRRPRRRAATSIWGIREWLTLNGFIKRVLVLAILYVSYWRLDYDWNKIDSMMHYYHGRMPPSMWNSPDMQAGFELEKSMQRQVGRDIDGSTFQRLFAKRQLVNVDTILTAVFVDIPKLCLPTYVLVVLVIRGGTGPFYRTACLEVFYLAWNEYWLFAMHQTLSSAFSKASYASFSRHMLHEVGGVLYICLLFWNPAERTHRLRFLFRSVALSIFMSIFFTAIWYSPFFFKSTGLRVVNLDEWGPKKYQVPELRPIDKRDIPFVTN